MVFSSLPSNWQQQPNHGSSSTANSSAQAVVESHVAAGSIRPGSMVDRARMANIPLPEAALKCPRCDSTNTKFCYFNNYSLTQPRHFCKTCRRYWTRGGALRNVPVGGGCRRNKRSSSSGPAQRHQMSTAAEIGIMPELNFPFLTHQMASVKMEDAAAAAFMAADHYWNAANAWPDLSAFTSSTTHF